MCSNIRLLATIARTLAGTACSGKSTVQQPPTCQPPDGGLPLLTNLTTVVHGDSVRISFDDVDGAKDYRVYLLPDPASVLNGGTAIKNAIYRCAGDREAFPVPTDNEPQVKSGAVTTYVNHDVEGFARTTADATLGYVYLTAGQGRSPVYALGDPAVDGDNLCYFHRWTASRVKKYTTSDAERASLLAAGWRNEKPGGCWPMREFCRFAPTARLIVLTAWEGAVQVHSGGTSSIRV